MKRLITLRTVGVFAAIVVLSSCGGGGGTAAIPVIPDTKPPTAAVSPVSGSRINGGAAINITFSEPMDAGSLVLGSGGDSMSAQSDGGVWSSKNTLRISPAAAWTEGAQTLTVDAKDKAGNALDTLNLTYTVDITAPTAGVTPASGSILSGSSQITVTFSESMDPASLTLGGALGAESGTGAWSQTVNPNDTLIIGPSDEWGAGPGRMLTVNAADVAGNQLETMNLSYNVDSALPTAAVTPDNGSAIAHDTAVKVVFSETMDTGSLALGGSMQVHSSLSWSQTVSVNDTLTISPTTGFWPAGGSKTLVIDIRDLAGNAIDSLNLVYHVLDGNVYVHPSGNDANPGTGDLPLLTIKAGITQAKALFATASVRVAAGTYDVSYSAGTHIVLSEGISLYGGYDPASWDTRDPVVNTTTIRENGSSIAGSLASANRVMHAGTGVTTATIVDGFTLEGRQLSGGCATTVQLDGGSPTLENNIIEGGAGSSTYGVYITGQGSPVLRANQIDSGSGTAERNGIRVVTAEPTIEGNTILSTGPGIFYQDSSVNQDMAALIEGNTIQAQATGVYIVADWTQTTAAPVFRSNYIESQGSNAVHIQGASPVFDGNVISAGTSSYDTNGVVNTAGGSVVLTNNIIFGGVSTTGWVHAVRLLDPSTPVVRNNTIVAGSGGIGSVGIYASNAHPNVDNNIIIADAGSTISAGIYNNVGVGVPLTVRNNDIVAGAVYRDTNPAHVCPGDGDGDGDGTTCSIAEMEALTYSGTFAAGGNVSTDPLLADIDGADNDLTTMADNNWRLQAGSPASVKEGGLDFSSSFTLDKEGADRTVPWSIGAYEQN